jgi:hypothetical protein
MTQRRGIGSKNVPEQKKKFDPKLFEALAEDLTSGRIPVPRFTVSDDEVPGLRAIIRNSGQISFHVQYSVRDDDTGEDTRPYLKIGDYPKMKIGEARELARTIRTLANMNIDPQAGLHERLVRELKEKGAKWRP